MKESKFDEMANQVLVQIMPGCMNELEKQGIPSESNAPTEQIITAATAIAGVPTGYALTFTKELLKKVLLEAAIIERD